MIYVNYYAGVPSAATRIALSAVASADPFATAIITDESS
jgi:hypothetical protein